MTDVAARVIDESADDSDLAALLRFHERISARIGEHSPEQLLADIGQGIEHALAVDEVALIVVDSRSDKVVARHSGDGRLADVPDEELLGGLASDVLQAEDGRLIPIPHVAHVLIPTEATSAAVMPLHFREHYAGALMVASTRADRVVGEHQLRLLEAMALLSSVVIGYSIRLRSEQRQRALAVTMREVTAAMTSTLDLRGVLDGVLISLDQVLAYDTATLMLRQDEVMRVVASRGLEDRRALSDLSIDFDDDPLLAGLGPDSEPRIVTSWDGIDRAAYVGEAVSSLVAVPLISRNRVIGMFTVGSFQEHAYSLEDSLIVEAFADHAAVAIQNARLFQRTQASLAKSETLYRVAQSLIAGSTLSETLQIVVDGVAEAIPADRVSLITMNPSQELVIHFVRGGPGRDRVVAVNFEELWQGLAGHVMRQRAPIISNGDRADEREGPQARARREATQAGPTMVAPLRYRGKLFGVLTAINRPDQPAFTSADLNMLVAMANQAAMSIENARLFDEVQRLAVTDELTKLSNRRGFYELARRELERSHRTGLPVTGLMLDIDGFKKVNDTYGHAVGDEVLRELARRSREAVREVDLVGRYGGEEFCYLLPDADRSTAERVAERIRREISDHPIETAAGPLDIKVSIGVAFSTGHAEETVESLLDRADTAMYHAKDSGGDRISVD